MATPDPAVMRRRLRTVLRQLRTQEGLTQESVADSVMWSISKLVRIESGTVGITTSDLQALLNLYGVQDPAQINELVQLARGARQPGWSRYRDVLPQALLTYFGHEGSAKLIRQFEPMIIPGLLQTEEYARVLLSDSIRLSGKHIDRRVEAQLERQELLYQANHPELDVILDEAVLHRSRGSAGIMRHQLYHLLELAAQPTIRLQVLPFSAGTTPVVMGGFTILEFADPADETLLWAEGTHHGSMIEGYPDEAAYYLDTFDQFQRLALGPEDSAVMLQQVMAELPQPSAERKPMTPESEDQLGQYFVL